MNGLDLFSGIGGLSLALSPWVHTIAYCEKDRYAQSVLLSRMSEGRLHNAPIWDDVTTLRGEILPDIEIIFGGFPCQDISTAGRGEGLEGKRSGLFFEIMRLAEETKPKFIFLENVPAIRTRGLSTVVETLAEHGYDSRWTTLSAQEVGANHKRDRWFLLAHANSMRKSSEQNSRQFSSDRTGNSRQAIDVANSMCEGLERFAESNLSNERSGRLETANASLFSRQHWAVEPDVGRVVNGLPSRVDRIKCLGNAVVPLQAREAFKELMGLNLQQGKTP